MFGTIFFPQCPSISTPSNHRNPKAFSLKASAPHLPLASRVFVRNLSYSTDENCLRKEFSNFGPVVEVKLVKDESKSRSKGYAFVQYSSQDDAMLAIENLDRKRLDGRVIYVELAKPVTSHFAAYPRASGPPTEHSSENQAFSERSSKEKDDVY